MSDKYPRWSADFADLSKCIDTFVLGDFPKAPLLHSTSRVLTQGSCFAENIFQALHARGIAAQYMKVQEVSNSPVGNALGMTRASADLRFIAEMDAFIFTMGVSFGLEESGYLQMHDVADNVKALRTITDTLRGVNPRISVILSVSPVPLNRSLSPSVPAVLADCVSKSTLRVAVDAYMREAPSGVYYWPSFEIVRWLGAHLNGPAYGADDDQQRHVNRAMVDLIVQKFLERFSAQTAN